MSGLLKVPLRAKRPRLTFHELLVCDAELLKLR